MHDALFSDAMQQLVQAESEYVEQALRQATELGVGVALIRHKDDPVVERGEDSYTMSVRVFARPHPEVPLLHLVEFSSMDAYLMWESRGYPL